MKPEEIKIPNSIKEDAEVKFKITTKDGREFTGSNKTLKEFKELLDLKQISWIELGEISSRTTIFLYALKKIEFITK